MKIETPTNIEVLLHYHVSPSIHPRFDEKASVEEAVEFLMGVGALERYFDSDGKGQHGHYQTTELGAAWVTALCNTKRPTAIFSDEHGNILSTRKREEKK